MSLHSHKRITLKIVINLDTIFKSLSTFFKNIYKSLKSQTISIAFLKTWIISSWSLLPCTLLTDTRTPSKTAQYSLPRMKTNVSVAGRLHRNIKDLLKHLTMWRWHIDVLPIFWHWSKRDPVNVWPTCFEKNYRKTSIKKIVITFLSTMPTIVLLVVVLGNSALYQGSTDLDQWFSTKIHSSKWFSTMGCCKMLLRILQSVM